MQFFHGAAARVEVVAAELCNELLDRCSGLVVERQLAQIEAGDEQPDAFSIQGRVQE